MNVFCGGINKCEYKNKKVSEKFRTLEQVLVHHEKNMQGASHYYFVLNFGEIPLQLFSATPRRKIWYRKECWQPF